MPKNDDQNNYDDEFSTENEESYDEQTDDENYVGDSTDEWSEDTEESQPAPKKKRSMLMTIIVIAVAIVGVIGFLVVKGAGNAPVPEVAADAAVAPPSVATSDSGAGLLNLQDQAPADLAQPQPAIPVPVEQPPQGLMDNPEIVNQESPQPAQIPSPSMTAIEPEPAQIQEIPQNGSGVVATIDAVTPDVKPVSDFPTVDSIIKPDAVQPTIEPVPSLADVAPAVPTEQQSATVTAIETPVIAEEKENAVEDLTTVQSQLKDATAKIVELQKSLADKDAELLQQKEKTSVPSSEVESLKKKISELEGRLTSATPEKAAEEPADEVVSQSAPAKKSVIKAKTELKRTTWILKSAKIGRAVVSDKSTGDYKTIFVGDNIVGLGKIISINETPSGWVVQGTQGKIAE